MERIYIDGRRVSLATLAKKAHSVTYVYVENCPGLTALPDMPAATSVYVENCPGLTALPDMPAATYVSVRNCPGLTALPDMPAATSVYVYNCPGLRDVAHVGKSDDGYLFTGLKLRGEWFVQAGCKMMPIAAAREYCARRPDRLALVEKIAAFAAERDGAVTEAQGERA